ncbi:MAG: hypothetical protein RL268_108 [Pseudomonadota bacterium]|jgi:hypothetical protein
MVEDITKARSAILCSSEDALCAWLDGAEPGERLEYYRGFLARDVDAAKPRRLPEWRRQSLLRLAARARWAAENGVVHLVQIRRGGGEFSYVAIARPKSPKIQSMIAALMLPQAA